MVESREGSWMGSQVDKFALEFIPLQRRAAKDPGFNFNLEDFKLHSVNLADEDLVY